MNRRTAKVVQLNESLAVILPRDWTRGMEIEKGDLVELTYNGAVHVRAIRPAAASGGAAP
jgi:hypothetical protein